MEFVCSKTMLADLRWSKNDTNKKLQNHNETLIFPFTLLKSVKLAFFGVET